MPTLSQWKILTRLLLKKNREATQASRDEAEATTAEDTDPEQAGEGEPVRALVPRTGAMPEVTFTVQQLGFDSRADSRPDYSSRNHESRPNFSPRILKRISSDNILHVKPEGGSGSNQHLESSNRATDGSGRLVEPCKQPGIQKGRPRSSKTVWLQNIAMKVDDGTAISPRVEQILPKYEQQSSGKANAVDTSANEPSVDRAGKCVFLVKENAEERQSANCNSSLIKLKHEKEKSVPDLLLSTAAENESTPVRQAPTRPCLKRSDSCFIRRPDSRTKSVRFDRPFSSTQLSHGGQTKLSHGGQTTQTVNSKHFAACGSGGDEEATRENSGQDRNSAPFKSFGGVPVQKFACFTGQVESSGIHDVSAMKRPSSSGPAVLRGAQTKLSGLVKKVSLVRKASFPLERRASSPVSPGMNVETEKSLPRSPAFLVRRDSILSRNFPAGQPGNRPGFPSSSSGGTPGLANGFKVSSSQETATKVMGAKVSAAKRPSESFEPYVIKDGHLVKRTLKSPTGGSTLRESRDHEDQGHWKTKGWDNQHSQADSTAQRSLAATNTTEPKMATKWPEDDVRASHHPSVNNKLPEHANKDTGTARHHQTDTEPTDDTHDNNGLSQNRQGENELSQNARPIMEERPSSRRRISTPTTMVAMAVRAMSAGRGRGGDPLIDGQGAESSGQAVIDGHGAARRWSRIHQAIISAEPLEDKTTESDRRAKTSTAQMECLDDSEQAELEKLGFRKPSKGKKKKKKKKSESGDPRSASGSGKESQRVINLREDPVLVKVSKKNQNVGKFTGPPEPKPNAVCFEMPGTSLTHHDVKMQVDKLLRNCPGVRLVELQFHHRSLINNIKEMQNRWIITTNSVAGRNRLAGASINFPGFQTQLRRYDDIVNTEFQQFTRMTNFAKMMVTRLGNGKR